MTCSSSPSLIATLDPGLTSSSSIFAEEGSAAHCLAELIVDQIARNVEAGRLAEEGVFDAPIIGTVLRKCDSADEYVANVDPWTGEAFAGTTVNSDHEFIADEEMEECIWFYAETILGFVEECIGHPVVQSETTMFPIPGDEVIFGTTDCVVIDQVGGTIWVVDLKYGKGIKVTAPNNSQAMFYALGAIETGEYGDQDIVNVVIIQPRVFFADGRRVSDWRTTAGELRQWRDDTFIPAIEATRSPALAKYEAGSHCRFCPATAVCPIMQQRALTKAQEAFGEDLDSLPAEQASKVELILPGADDPDAIAAALKIADVLDNWTKKVRVLADLRATKDGLVLPGFKVVRKRTRRIWADEDALIVELESLGELDTATKRKALTPKQAEKAGLDPDWIESRTEKPEGELTVAHETDPRAAVEDASVAFGAIEAEVEEK
tara:strand:+ start:4501 stop:5802 length:1302 start_codon:yes stop_codon:yes gene_type:complete